MPFTVTESSYINAKDQKNKKKWLMYWPNNWRNLAWMGWTLMMVIWENCEFNRFLRRHKDQVSIDIFLFSEFRAKVFSPLDKVSPFLKNLKASFQNSKLTLLMLFSATKDQALGPIFEPLDLIRYISGIRCYWNKKRFFAWSCRESNGYKPRRREGWPLERQGIKHGLAGALADSITADDYFGECKLDEVAFLDFEAKDGVKINIPKRDDATNPFARNY